MQEPVTGWRARRWQITVLIVGIALPVVWVYFMRLSGVSDGTLVLPTSRQSSVVVEQSFGDADDLQAGDRVDAVDGTSIDAWVSGAVPALRPRNGDVLHYSVDRDGVVHDVAVHVGPYPFDAALRTDGVLLVLVAFLLVLVGGVYLIRPFDPAAIAMMTAGLALLWVITEFPLGLQVLDLVGGGGIPGYVGGDLGACVMWGAILNFALVFPDPPPLLRRRPWLVAGCYLLPLLLYGLSLLWNLPTAVNPVAHLFALITISGTAAVVFPVLIGVRLIVGYRGAKDVDVRRRFRWIFASLLVGFALYLLFGQLSALVLGRPLVPYQWLLLAILPIPAALAAGILRYRLFDIEVILTRSLLVGAMTGIVAAGYAAVLLLTPRLDVLIGPPPPLVLLLLGGGIAAAAFAVRRQLARRVTTIVYGHRNNPYEVVERLSQLDTATAADQLFPDVVETLARALRLPYVRLELRGPDGNIETVAQYGAATGTPIGLPIQSNADVLGELELDVGAGREPFGPADRRLLDDITRHLAEACRTVLLARALQRSRERLVLAREEERRRLRRDLHDGIGPTLAALAMQMDLTGTMLERDLRGVERKLQDMGVTTRDLIGDIRRIVEDLRPPALDQLGLVGAIIENTQGFIRPDRPGGGAGFAVTVTTANDLGELPAGVEVAAFRIAVEAVTNAARYSGSRTCVVTLRRSVDLLLQVEDDGHGLQARIQGGGVGLVSMRERAAELGGDCVIENRSDRSGTVVRARLPLQGPVRSR